MHNPPEKYIRQDYPLEPKWDDVKERLELLSIPDDPEQRAEEVVKDFASSGKDIYYLSMLVHQVAVPQIESIPTDYAMKVASPSGERPTILIDPNERMELFDYAASLIRELDSKRTEANSREFLERSSNIMALSIVLAHSYADGNGRTARLVGGLIRDGYSNNEDIELLSKNRPENGFRINSYVPRDSTKKPEEILQAAASLNVPLERSKEYEQSISSVFSTPYS